MQVKSIAECSKHSAILSTFIISYHLSLRSLLCLFSSGSLWQGLQYSWQIWTFIYVFVTGMLVFRRIYAAVFFHYSDITCLLITISAMTLTMYASFKFMDIHVALIKLQMMQKITVSHIVFALGVRFIWSKGHLCISYLSHASNKIPCLIIKNTWMLELKMSITVYILLVLLKWPSVVLQGTISKRILNVVVRQLPWPVKSPDI